jgi:predicted ABC-type ATPase
VSARRKPEKTGEGADYEAALGRILDQRPMLVAVAGPNGAGRTAFYHAHLKPAGLRFLNADEVARELEVDAYEAARVLGALREQSGRVFETVLSDPVGEKVTFLQVAAKAGYAVVLCFIGLASPQTSEQRVAMRVAQGGHNVPAEKLASRFPRTLVNLRRAIRELPQVSVYDNDDLRSPFRRVAVFEAGRMAWSSKPMPSWLEDFAKA